MKRASFLEEIAAKIYGKHPRLEEVTIVFPNRRAIIYFRKHLSDLLDKPAFPPRLLTIEDFIAGFSSLRVPDKLELVYQLYKVYQQVHRSSEDEENDPGGLEQFYFWGDMLLRDFDEIDKYMVDADLLFKDLSHLKDLDSNFDFLTEEQREFLRNFWGNFDVDKSLNKKKFLYMWKKLPEVYRVFGETLRNQRLAYEGMIHREVAVSLERDQEKKSDQTKLYFAGFNALTRAEERILSWAVLRGASVFWDLDAYYVNNVSQEAGKFFRQYQEHPAFRTTFPADIPSHTLLRGSQDNDEPRIRIFSAAQPIGQAKVMAHMLKEELAAGMKPEETIVVLPDEKLLLPVLHGIAGSVDTMNVTMGFPLSSTPLFNFIELLLDLQITRRHDHFNHQQVLAVLGHPYVVAANAVAANAKRKEIVKHNWVHIPEGYLATEVPLHRLIFARFSGPKEGVLIALIGYIQSVVRGIGELGNIGDLDKEYAFHFLKFFKRLEEIFSREPLHPGSSEKDPGTKGENLQLKSFLRLVRQLSRSHKIPFRGEPLKGLQVMGVLETRNLDFKNVFILSMNEGSFPAFASKGSYIPYSIRRAYDMPTAEHQDAIYSYLFYRMLQRAERVSILYNAETDVLGQGEMSRYLQQLLFESGIPVQRKHLHHSIAPRGINPIVIRKDDVVMDGLLKLNEGNKYFKGISPSALNAYLECRLKFYFRHVAKIREPDEVEEELDARVLGNFLHEVMEKFYKGIALKKGNREITASDYSQYLADIDKLIDDVFIDAYRLDPNKKVEYGGQRLVVREIVRRFAHRIIEIDKDYAPFVMEGLEQEGLMFSIKLDRPPYTAVIGGKIDRVDRKGDRVRVIDYKTGKDKLNFDGIASLFARDAGRNKAAFQTLLYALLYQENFQGRGQPSIITPGLINRMNLFDENFSFGLKLGRETIEDVAPMLPEFRARLKDLFEELFNPEVAFNQTDDLENCRNCPYTQICYR